MSNPESNQLPAGIQEDALIKAIKYSGYPLQGKIAGFLKNDFKVIEEWGYIDRETQKHRSLDILARRTLHNSDDSLDFVPGLVLLIECKRSRQPFVFFRNVAGISMEGFPYILGIKARTLIMERGNNRCASVPISKVLGLDELPFIDDGPLACTAFAKAVPSGKKVELSGSDLYGGIMVPLTKALDHAAGIYPSNYSSLGAKSVDIALAVTILDAPMVAIEDPESDSEPTARPWVRIVRQEALANSDLQERHRFVYVDIVHSSFFGEFIANHVMPFAEEFSSRVSQRQRVFTETLMVNDVFDWHWKELRARHRDV